MRQGQIIPLGSNFDQHNHMTLYRFYYNFLHFIALGTGADNPMGPISSSK